MTYTMCRVRESSLYGLMLRLSSIRDYKKQRYFRTWLAHARQRAYLRLRRHLEGRMLLARPAFNYPLMFLKARVHCELLNFCLLEYPDKPLPLDDFLARQHDLLTNKLPTNLRVLMTSVESTLNRLFTGTPPSTPWCTLAHLVSADCLRRCQKALQFFILAAEFHSCCFSPRCAPSSSLALPCLQTCATRRGSCGRTWR